MTRSLGHASGNSFVPKLSPELARDWGLLAGPNERAMRRRIGWVWGLLFFNVLTYSKGSSNLIPLPHQVGAMLPESALGIAFILIITANKRLLVRPNVLLVLFSVMCLLAAIMSFRGYFGHGSTIRWFRFAVFVGAVCGSPPLGGDAATSCLSIFSDVRSWSSLELSFSDWRSRRRGRLPTPPGDVSGESFGRFNRPK